jgi:tRNA(Ile)-lysidine synthase
MLKLLLQRSDLHCHVIHLDHETREGESGEDARFVAGLCARWSVELTLGRRSQLEPVLPDLPVNRSARFRALRLELFRSTCARCGLDGVIVAHHADDQAETILQRLLRGSGPPGLTGMRPRATVGGLTILRPLLEISSRELRAFLEEEGQVWREDSSNRSGAYQRNRVRVVLARHPQVALSVLELGGTMQALAEWTRATSPTLGVTFQMRELGDLADVLAEESARRWLVARGAVREELSGVVLWRLIEMARDAASPARRHFPGKVFVLRRRGEISGGRAG